MLIYFDKARQIRPEVDVRYQLATAGAPHEERQQSAADEIDQEEGEEHDEQLGAGTEHVRQGCAACTL